MLTLVFSRICWIYVIYFFKKILHFVYISTYLGNMLVIEWGICSFNNCLVLYIEKDVANNIDSETIISHNDFKIRKLVKGNFKTLCICISFYFVMLIYSSFIIIKKN